MTDIKSNDPFLKQVAEAYVDNEPTDALADYCFVVPNKRSAVFLSKYLGEQLKSAGGGTPALAPDVVTISDFITDMSDYVEVSRIEMLFILYQVYAGIVRNHLPPKDAADGKGLVDFNRFQYWGDILINDFGDVDRYMVDANQLFRNVENLKEISANYLTPEQIEVIKKYWNEDLVPEPVKEFWNHIVHVNPDSTVPAKKNVARFVKLWQVMHEVYDQFRSRLASEGFAYGGMMYREVAQRISKEMSVADFDCSRYIFVGFSVLSESEQTIFRGMQRLGIADFYWDYASSAFRIPGNRASRFIARYVKEFPSRYRIALDPLSSYPEVTVIAVPSTFGQAKAIDPILRRLYPGLFAADAVDGCNEAAQSCLEDTAIVLPDENMVSPLLNAMPPQVTNVNVTMGFSLSHTTVASLIKNIVSMQLRARELRSVDTFFFEDVVSLLTHPLIRSRYASLCNSIVATVNERRMFNIPVTFFNAPEYAPLKPLFEVVKNVNDPDGVTRYLDSLLLWLANVIDPGMGSRTLELQYINSYRDAIMELRRLSRLYLDGGKVYLEDKTVFHLVERILGNQTVAYEGMPLQGLQVMGVLETRALDFDNIVILSMNERIFPRKHYARTFIPNALRRGYGMATIEHQESMYAYYFYRLIARARHVYLLYDARTSGLRSGDMSRYISQIKYQFPPSKVKFTGSQYRMMSSKSKPVSVVKTPRIMAELAKFTQEGGRNLSAHALNTYISCPLQFYLASIEKYYPEDELHDYMDDATYGTIVHEVAERMYLDMKGVADSLPLTPDVLRRLSDTKLIGEYVTSSIRSNYLHVAPDDPRPLHGDAAILRRIMVRTVAKMFEREGEFSGVEFISGEESKYVRLKIDDDLTVNLNYRIDRVDRVTNPDGTSFIRLIDYKTGNDPLQASTVEKLFSHDGNTAPPKAIFQLLLYCNAYVAKEGYNGAIQPYIYKLRKAAVEPFGPLKLLKAPLLDYRDVNDAFMSRLSEMLHTLFDQDIPFTARPSEAACKYCKFKELCFV